MIGEGRRDILNVVDGKSSTHYGSSLSQVQVIHRAVQDSSKGIPTRTLRVSPCQGSVVHVVSGIMRDAERPLVGVQSSDRLMVFLIDHE